MSKKIPRLLYGRGLTKSYSNAILKLFNKRTYQFRLLIELSSFVFIEASLGVHKTRRFSGQSRLPSEYTRESVMKYALSLMMSALMCASCQSQPQKSQVYIPRVNWEASSPSTDESLRKYAEAHTRDKLNCSMGNRIIYFRDPRAPSLCYAGVWHVHKECYSNSISTSSLALTWVPCSDDVTPLVCNHIPSLY